MLSLPTPAAVREVAGQLRAARPRVIVLDTSTNDPGTARTLQRDLAEAGGDYADCPVLGRPDRIGNWAIPVGGSQAAYEHACAVLAPVAQRVVHVGPAGTGSVIKVLNNMMLSAINAVTADALVLAEAAGLDPGVFVDVVIDSGAASVSGLFRDVAPRAVDGDIDPTFSLRLMHKDAALGLAMAHEHDVPLLVGAAAQALNTMGLASGHGDEDSISVIKALEALTGRQAGRREVDDAVDTAGPAGQG